MFKLAGVMLLAAACGNVVDPNQGDDEIPIPGHDHAVGRTG